MHDLIPFVDLKTQTQHLKPEFDEAIQRVVSDCSFILGPAVDAFEAEFAEFVGARHAVSTGSGLDALRLALDCIGIGPGDECIVPANTFIATALAVSQVNAQVVLVDCCAQTMNMDLAQVEAAVTPRTRAILPVHFAGRAMPLGDLLDVANKHHLAVVEDAAQAHGAKWNDASCGTFGSAGCFSFYPGKNLGAFGDGGMIVTKDDDLAALLRRRRNYGQSEKYHHTEAGCNSRLDSIQAAILSVKLKQLSEWNELRRQHANTYRRLLDGVGDIGLPSESSCGGHVYHLFIITTSFRDQLQKHLGDHNIQTGIHYPIPIHLQPAYSGLGHHRDSFPVTERLAETMLSLPMFPELRIDQITRVADAIKDWFQCHSC